MSTVLKQRPVTRLTGVNYDEYVRYSKARGNQGLRMAYHDGVLEIMSPEFRQDTGVHQLSHIVLAYCKAFRVPYQPAGSTTFFKREPGRRKGKGKEPDASFYLRDAVAPIVGKDDLDLTVDPPPSLWIEVDNWGSSKAKLPLYAGLSVPEIWRYHARERTLWFGLLAGADYDEVAASEALPGLTAVTVLGLLDQGRNQAMWEWDLWLEGTWFPEHRQELLETGAGR